MRRGHHKRSLNYNQRHHLVKMMSIITLIFLLVNTTLSPIGQYIVNAKDNGIGISLNTSSVNETEVLVATLIDTKEESNDTLSFTVPEGLTISSIVAGQENIQEISNDNQTLQFSWTENSTKVVQVQLQAQKAGEYETIFSSSESTVSASVTVVAPATGEGEVDQIGAETAAVGESSNDAEGDTVVSQGQEELQTVATEEKEVTAETPSLLSSESDLRWRHDHDNDQESDPNNQKPPNDDQYNHIDIFTTGSFTYKVDNKDITVELEITEEDIDKVKIYDKDGNLLNITPHLQKSTTEGFEWEWRFNQKDFFFNKADDYTIEYTFNVTINGTPTEFVFEKTYNFDSTENKCPGFDWMKGLDIQLTGEDLKNHFTSGIIIKKIVTSEDNSLDGTFNFNVLNSAGDTVKTVAVKTTNGLGSIVVNGLEPGDYTVVEVSPDSIIGNSTLTQIQAGETIYSPTDSVQYKTSVKVEEGNNKTVTFENVYEEKVGSLTIKKEAKDSENNPLKGTFEFVVNDGTSDKKIQITTDENGKGSYTINNLKLGTYTVTEVDPKDRIAGYNLVNVKANGDILIANADNYSTTVQVNEGDQNTLAFENVYEEKVGSLTIKKEAKDSENNPLKGTFEFVVNDGTSDKKIQITTDEDGKGSFTINNLKLGIYTVTEVDPKDRIAGYNLVNVKANGDTLIVNADNYYTTVQVNEGDQNTLAFENVYEEKVGSLTIKKEAKDLENNPLKGTFEFVVNDGTSDKKIQITTDKDGKGSFTIKGLKLGKYTVTEVDPSEEITGYKLVNVKIDDRDLTVSEGSSYSAIVTVNEGDQNRVAFENVYEEKEGSLTITKTVSGIEEEGKKDSTFTFLVTGPDNYSKEHQITTVEGTNSIKIDGLKLGEYTVTELDPTNKIDGYNLVRVVVGGEELKPSQDNSYLTKVTVNEGDQNSVAFENVYEEKEGSLTITKTVTGTNQTGIFTFKVTGPNGYNQTFVINTAETNTVEIPNLKLGEYTVIELDPKDKIKGYNLVNVKANGTDVTVNAEDLSYSTTVQVNEGDQNSVAFENVYEEKEGSLTITKTVTGTKQTGIFTFVVTGPNGYNQTFTINTAETNTVEIPNLKLGEYTVTEQDPTKKFTGYNLVNVKVNGNDATVNEKDQSYSTFVTVNEGNENNVVFENVYAKKLPVLSPSLKVEKTADKTTANPGDTITYTITVTNTGNVDLTGITLEDVFTKGEEKLPLTLEGYTGPFTLEVGGEPKTFTASYVVPEQTAPGTVYKNVVTAEAEDGTNGSDEVKTEITSDPEMEVVKTADKTTANPGDIITYTITVTNTGNVDLTGITIEDVFTKGEEKLPLTLEGYTGPFTLEVGGEPKTFTSSYVVPEQTAPGTVYKNVVTAEAEDGTNGSDEVTVEVNNAPKLEVTKTADKTQYLPGETVIYTINVTNTGNVDLEGITLDDVFSKNDVVAEQQLTVEGYEGAFDLATGETVSFISKFVIPTDDLADTTYKNVVTTTTSDVSEEAEVVIVVDPSYAFTIEKKADKAEATIGETVTYSIVVTNTGNKDLTNVLVKDDMIGLDTIINQLAVNESKTLTGEYIVTANDVGELENIATATVEIDGEPITQNASVIVKVNGEVAGVVDENTVNPQTGDTTLNTLLTLFIFLLAGSGLYAYRKKYRS